MQVIAAAAVAALLLVGAAGCGGGSSDSSSSSDGSTKTTQGSDKSSDSGSDEGDSAEAGDAGGDLPNPCDLVPIEKASEILGGESAEPDAEDSTVGVGSRTCSWQTQASVDNPTLDGAGHILLLQAISPPETMDMDEFWKASATAADESADIEGCDEAFWMGGMLSALKGGVYLTGSAGLADTSEDAKASVTDLVSTACSNL